MVQRSLIGIRFSTFGPWLSGALRGCDVDVTLIDRRNRHIFWPLLYQVATALLAPSDVATPIWQLAIQKHGATEP
jgi:NADH dehydrogenase FAD-containing subunit